MHCTTHTVLASGMFYLTYGDELCAADHCVVEPDVLLEPMTSWVAL
jgi:hypothetical protein